MSAPSTSSQRPAAVDHAAPSPGRAALRAGATAAAGAVTATVLAWAALAAGGAELVVTQGGSGMEVGLLQVVAATMLPLVVGTAALALATRRSARAWPVLAWTGVALAVATLPMPLIADATTGTRLGLAAMHLLVGAAWWLALRRARPAARG